MQTNSPELTVEEELFCTRYELEILSGIVNQGMLERWVPGFCGMHTHKEHLSRYEWVKDFVKNKNVLDIACGTGFGSFKMATEGQATNITSCDIDVKTLKYASLRNRHPLIDFQVQDAEVFNFNKKFDTVISFETIEHLKKTESFLVNVNNALVSEGAFFVSTPISNVEQNNKPVNIYHEVEWGFGRFQEILSEYFEIENVFLQLYSSPAKPDNRIVAKGLRKAGIIKIPDKPVIEKLIPFKWDSNEIKKETIGTLWKGYQILQCKKK